MDDLASVLSRLSPEKRAALLALASDPEIRRLGEGAGGETLARAARSGDAAALRAAAEGLLSTREGRALAERLSALGYGRG